jgi:hypothetical protein
MMAAKISFGLSDHELGREEKGVTFQVAQDKEKAGKLVVSKGGLRWYPKGNSKTNHKLDWRKFGAFMIKNGQLEK